MFFFEKKTIDNIVFLLGAIESNTDIDIHLNSSFSAIDSNDLINVKQQIVCRLQSFPLLVSMGLLFIDRLVHGLLLSHILSLPDHDNVVC